jgi:hypothetical protein
MGDVRLPRQDADLEMAPETDRQQPIGEGAEYHCEPMAPQLRNERVFDWLETHAQPVGS